MAQCDYVHPEDNKRRCILPASGHIDHVDREGPTWQDPEQMRQRAIARAQKTGSKGKRQRKSAMVDIAAAVAGAKTREQAVARATDPETSFEAAASLANLRDSQAEVLLLLVDHGPMSHGQLIECAERQGVKQSTSGIRTRCEELVRAGLVVDSGERVKTEHGRDTIVWSAVPIEQETH